MPTSRATGCLSVGRRILLVTCVGATFACAESGVITDETTGKPLAGVFVIARWWGSTPNPIQPNRTCYHMEVAVTDGLGRFSHGDPRNVNPMLIERRREYALFKEGLSESRANNPLSTSLRMKQFTGRVQDRFDFAYGAGGRGCPDPESKLLPVLHSIHNEAKTIAQTAAQLRTVAAFRYEIERGELGEDTASRNLAQTIAQIRDKEGKAK